MPSLREPGSSSQAVLIVGLGNPGSEYEGTRHNIGFQAVERFAAEAGSEIRKKGFGSYWSKVGLQGREVYLQLPQTYMNLSGQAVREIADYYKIPPRHVMLVHDELDLPLGKIKQGFASGAAGHRGVSSVTEHLGTKEFWRLRLGIGRPERKEQVSDFVLHPFSREEDSSVEEMIRDCVGLLNKFILEVVK